MTDPLNGRGRPLAPEFAFKVKLVAVVRVRASDETVARRALPSVLSPPGTVDIKVTNENNAALGVNAVVTDVDFSIEEKRHAVRGRWRAHQAGLTGRACIVAAPGGGLATSLPRADLPAFRRNFVDFVTRNLL